MITLKFDSKDVLRFYGNCHVSPSGCWLWDKQRSPSGYGAVKVKRKPWRAHRFSYAIHKGDIPKDKCVLHRCDVPACVNPDHLWLGTNWENSQDMVAKGRSTIGLRNGKHTHPEKVLRGEASNLAKITRDQATEIRLLFWKQGKQMKELADLYGLCRAQIGRILRREVWSVGVEDGYPAFVYRG